MLNMPIVGVEQPCFIQVDQSLRLRRFDGIFDFALPWYRDEETVYLVDGNKEIYNLQKLRKMYRYLDQRGELYFIELLQDGKFVPIGDVTFWREDMPIVIASPYRNRGIGKKVVSTLVSRAADLGYNCIYVNTIYDYNIGSRRCFEAVGFVPFEKTNNGHRYKLTLK